MQKKSDDQEKKLEELAALQQTHKTDISNIIDNQNQWGTYFEEKIASFGIYQQEVNFRFGVLEQIVSTHLMQPQPYPPNMSQGPPQDYQNWYPQGGMPDPSQCPYPPEENNWEERFGNALTGNTPNSQENSDPPNKMKVKGRGDKKMFQTRVRGIHKLSLHPQLQFCLRYPQKMFPL